MNNLILVTIITFFLAVYGAILSTITAVTAGKRRITPDQKKLVVVSSERSIPEEAQDVIAKQLASGFPGARIIVMDNRLRITVHDLGN
jgi:hypothetical protein